jgi:hypothetical protein
VPFIQIKERRNSGDAKKSKFTLTMTGFCFEKNASLRPAVLDINVVAE